jgi:hypothetical protein
VTGPAASTGARPAGLVELLTAPRGPLFAAEESSVTVATLAQQAIARIVLLTFCSLRPRSASLGGCLCGVTT